MRTVAKSINEQIADLESKTISKHRKFPITHWPSKKEQEQ